MAPKTPKALATPMMAFSPGLMVVLDAEVGTGPGTPVEIVSLAGDDDTFMRAGEEVDVETDMSLEEKTVLVDGEVVVVGTE